MPLLYVYDKTGNVVATQTATIVSNDGTQATFPFPSSLTESGYSLAIVNRNATSTGFAPAGDNLLSIASSQTISGSPFGVAVGAQTTETINCVYVEVGNPPHQTTQCTTSSSNPNTIPVVSLYSANQVMIGSTLVNVGANPTAVGTYAVSPVTNTTSNGSGYVTTILSGSLRAIVANSGSNTVTILNTVTYAPVATVTVGNQPVALTVDSTGGYAYVANYTDSTISRVNLSTNTAAGTVTVGGHPTSVALTSGGTLWVGGVGFLTEVNTSTMTATATEAISGKTIVGLGYSDSVGQIVATTVDSSNNVYVDQIAPSSVTAGGTYATVASNQVSSVGTHLNTHTEAQVRSFTNTLASQSILNTNQPGAPPLVVQDGWAVVTATPTGFSITDITGNVVLVSEQTPSPITAIAIDPNLNVVYLTMPDSNTLLKVPLPGTN
ncbi:YncE family protein [Terracidiphilus sp.]|uniref:YncE family protein n=1 Tax=Terracidiphilus sp. TaxID=1964191 RepID=UPI003C29C5A9